MPQEPRHIVASTAARAVTHARITGDYHPGTITTSVNYNLMAGSLLYSALSLQPFKDVFWSTPVQPGSIYGPTAREPLPELHLLVSALTTGPVAPGDAVGLANVSLLLTAARAGDGMLLKPDRPAFTVETAFAGVVATRGGPLLNVSSTFSTHGPPGAQVRWHYVLAVWLPAPFSMRASDLPAPPGGTPATSYLAFDYFAPLSGGTPVDGAAPLVLQPGQGVPGAPADAVPTRYAVLAPVLPASGWVLYGDVGKAVPASRQRLANLTDAAGGFDVVVASSSAEAAVTLAVVPPAGSPAAAALRANAAGVATVTCAPVGGADVTLSCRTQGGCTCA